MVRFEILRKFIERQSKSGRMRYIVPLCDHAVEGGFALSLAAVYGQGIGLNA